MNIKSFIAFLLFLGVVWVSLVWGVATWFAPIDHDPVPVPEISQASG